jgi:hypothetical protein
MFEIQSRARALDNNLYVVAPNMGTYYRDADSDTPIDTFGGRSMVIDYRGRIVGKQEYGIKWKGGCVVPIHEKIQAFFDGMGEDDRLRSWDPCYEYFHRHHLNPTELSNNRDHAALFIVTKKSAAPGRPPHRRCRH